MSGLSGTVLESLQRLGQNIQNARKRRAMTMKVMAVGMGVSLPTLRKIEAGDPTVLIQHYAAALNELGMIDKLGELGGPGHDELGMMLANEKLPQRVRTAGKRRAFTEC